MEPFGVVGCLDGVAEDVTVEPTVGVDPRDDEFAALYAAHFDSLVRLAVLLVDSSAAAEDVVQDVFAKLYDRFDTVDSPRAWLRAAVTNACRNERRRLGTVRRFAPRLVGQATATDEPVDDLMVSLRRLPYRQRAVVVLRFYLDLPESEIALTLGIRPGTVKSALHRALHHLRMEIEQ